VQRLLILSFVAIVAYVCVVVAVNRSAVPRSGPLAIVPALGLARAKDRLTLLTWNLGYAGLGAESDFVADGGSHYLPPSRAAVLGNLRGITRELARVEADLFLLQEIARPGLLNYWVDVLGGVGRQLPSYASVYDADVATRLLPPPLRISHGDAVYSRLHIGAAERLLLPAENERLGGLLRHEYRMLIVRLPLQESAREWVVVDIHLAAFDAQAAVRREQLRAVLRFAEGEFRKGSPVIIGGDWNMEFVKDRFAHTTPDKHRFWLADFPIEELPPGWKAVFDPSVATVRTLYAPYEPGHTYVSVVDGFVVSPNVDAEVVKGRDLGFRYSDHQPVIATFRAH